MILDYFLLLTHKKNCLVGGGGGKGPAIKEKNFFWNFNINFLPFKYKNYFTLDNEIWTFHVKVCR